MFKLAAVQDSPEVWFGVISAGSANMINEAKRS